MDPAFSPRDGADEDEPMLGVRPSSPGTDRSHHESLLHGTDFRKKPARRRDCMFVAIVILCSLTLLVLPATFFLGISRQQSQAAESNSHEADASEQGPVGQQSISLGETTTAVSSTSTLIITTSTQASTTAATPSVATTSAVAQTAIPLADQLDLKTNFVVSNTTQVREYVFNVTRGISSPDGFSKSMILVNGQSPGPLIEANTGDTIRVVVHNNMPEDSTSIHWHGIDQKNSVWMDGVHMVTQCGIPPGGSFTYQFEIADQRGTFWYHAHVSVQYTDGLYGPLIIHDPEEKVPQIDDDKILLIGDIFHGDGENLLAQFLSASPSWSPKMPGMEPPPENIILNGQGVSNCSVLRRATPHHDVFHDMMEHGEMDMDQADGDDDAHSVDTPTVHCTGGSPYKTRIKSGQNLRLRLISHSTATPFWFSVDGHELSIFEIDGVEVEPIKTSRVFMYPGQRYSVLITANQTPGNYLIRATAATKCFHMPMHGHKGSPGAFASVNYQGTGILSYDNVDEGVVPIGSPWDLDSTSSPGIDKEPWTGSCHDLPFGLPKPLRAMKAYEVGERNHHYFRYQKYRARTNINDTVYDPPSDGAILWSMLDEKVLGNNSSESPVWDFPPEQMVLVSEDTDKAAQIVINSDNMMAHPWHLHGL
ncbi:hypothetical protein S7711_06079 [Stachybotrys chartarum IBT 7711]|uniref:Uncharacterized protein n=1 Tax=Stachybotrys chartarum (strain CBS 109288 / IBT 7711) TaxID=1280523 RepID=A0A084B8I9_STACB|nr:hypothetical protein S7711_06079 [Stachybotrys chartarum IBT 7711]